MSVNLQCKDGVIFRIKWGTIKCTFVFYNFVWIRDKGTKSDDQRQKIQM